MSRSETIRFRTSLEERAELEELREWVDEETISGMLRRGIDALKEESGFNLRDVEPGSIADGSASQAQRERNAALTQIAEAAARPALPAFVPGIGPRREPSE